MAARRRKSTRRGQTPGWLFMLGGLGLGLLVAAGVYVSGARTGDGGSQPAEKLRAVPAASAAAGAAAGTKPSAPSAATSSTSASTRGRASARPSSGGKNDARAADSKKAGNRETQFDFYEILPQYEVVVPEVETVTATPQPRASATTSGASAASGASTTSVAPVEAPGEYVLQAGSFRSHDEADRMQASLALLGIESRIQKVTIDDDEFHRVRVGPIDDLATLNRIRNQLRAAGVNALVMRMND